MDDSSLYPAKLPDKSTGKLMWGSLAVIVLSLVSLSFSNITIRSNKATLETFVISPSGEQVEQCQTGLYSSSVKEVCSANSYHYIEYQCYGSGSLTMGNPNLCNTPDKWKQLATADCIKRGNPTCTPSSANNSLESFPMEPTCPTPSPAKAQACESLRGMFCNQTATDNICSMIGDICN